MTVGQKPRPASSRPLSRGKRVLFAGITVLIVLVLLAGGAELVVRLMDPKVSFETWHSKTITYLEDADVDWKLEPRTYDWGQVNDDFFRGPRVPVEKTAGTLRVVVVGGSAAFDLWKKDDQTWAAMVGRQLAEQLGRPVEVLNAGTPGYSTWQSVRLLEDRLLAWKPDLVLVYHLYNDSLYFRFDDPERIAAAWRVNAKANYVSAAAHPHAAWDAFVAVLPRTGDFFRATVVRSDLESVLGEAAKVWHDASLESEVHPVGIGFYEANLRRMAAALAPTKTPLGIITQASMLRASNPPDQQAQIHYLYRGLNHERLWAAYQQAYAIPAKVAADTPDVFVVEAHGVVPPEAQYFHDEVHLTSAGSAVLAQTVTAGVARYLAR